MLDDMFLFLAAARAASFSVPTDHATIEEAIAAAEDGDSITIEQGDWDETLGIGKDLSFDGEGRITGSWTIEGSTVDIADLSFEPAEGRALSIDDATVALSGVSLQGGDAGVSYGGLIFVRDSELILDGCSLSNAVSARGGAIYSYSTDLYVSDTTFSSNQSLTDGSTPARGGAIRSENGTTTLVNSIFSTNSCDYGFGGAVSTYNSDTVIDSCAFTENSVGSLYGGALMVWDADATISDTTFERNSADLLVEGDHASGAAIGVAGSNPGTLSVLRSTFLDNSSEIGRAHV